MPGKIDCWPAWPEFSSQIGSDIGDPELVDIKRSIIAKYGDAALRQGWIKTCNQLKEVTDEIAGKGSDIIPVFDTNEIFQAGFSHRQQKEAKRVGAFVCRETIPRDELETLRNDLQKYVADNEDAISRWPSESPSMLSMFVSPVQNTLRTHPNQLRLQRLLNELWHSDSDETSSDPLIYLDGVRDRSPGQDFLGLGPHIDAGSLCRWADASYANLYHNIFSGNPEWHDCYNLALRMAANQELYAGAAHSSVLRTFQGWTALSPASLGKGTILVLPNVATVIAYVVLRPFFRPPENDSDILDAGKWTLDDSNAFPGTFKPDSQRLSRTSHPHLRLEECLVSMPPIRGGDTVWWHTDVCHAVDPKHDGEENATVAYIPACPTTPTNSKYVSRQLSAILEGRRPPDQDGIDECPDERTMIGYQGLDGISDEGKRALGIHT